MATGNRRRMKAALALVPIVLALGACGGTSGGGGAGGTGGGEDVGAAEDAIPGEQYTPEYLQGQSTCTIQPPDVLARDYDVKPQPKLIARAVAKSIEPTEGKKQTLVYKGCLTVLQAPSG